MKKIIYIFTLLLLQGLANVGYGQYQVGQTLEGRDTTSQFGKATAISEDGNRIVVGASESNPSNYVQVYEWSGNNWIQLGATIEGNTYYNSTFGGNVDISSDGNRILVASLNYFYVFDWNGTSWTQVGNAPYIFYAPDYSELKISGDGTGIIYGHIGEYPSFNGSVKVYSLVGSTWQLKGTPFYDSSNDEAFGRNVSISSDANTIAFTKGNYPPGEVFIYTWNGNSWNQAGNSIIGTYNILAGAGIDLNQAGDKIAVSFQSYIRSYEFSNGLWVSYGGPIYLPAGYYSNKLAFNTSGDVIAISTKELVAHIGKVQLYNLNSSGNWLALGQEMNADDYADSFGSALDLNGAGDRLVIGAGQPLNTTTQRGYVKVFDTNPPCTWNNNVPLNILGESANDQFGVALRYSPNGQFFIAGAPYGDGNGPNSGEVRIFEKNGSAFAQRGATLLGEAAEDRFGGAVAISDDGKYAIVGATFNDGGGQNAGHVRVFKWNGSDYLQIGQDIDGAANFDSMGESVDISSTGKYFAVGSPNNDSNSSASGKVQVYKLGATNHVPYGAPIYGTASAEYLGRAIRISDNGARLAIGIPQNSDVAFNAGQVRVYSFSGSSNSWVQIGQSINGTHAMDYFGASISLSKNASIIAVGSPYADPNGSNSGEVKVYAQSRSGNWVQRGRTLEGQVAGDNFFVVDLSDSGDRLVVGAPYSDLNGSAAGHITVYDFENANWTQNENTVIGDHAGDYFGGAISIAGDGTSIAVGARGHDGNGNWSGMVHFIETCPTNTKSMRANENEIVEDNGQSISEEITSSNFLIYPNPAQNIINWDKGFDGEQTVQVWDNLGRLVLESKTEDSFLKIDKLNSGIYFIIIHINGSFQRTSFEKI